MTQQLIEFFKNVFGNDITEIRYGDFPVIILKDKYPSQVIKFQSNIKEYNKIFREENKKIKKNKKNRKVAAVYPLFLSEEFIFNAQDSYPVDIFYIQHFTKNIYGQDIFKEIKLDKNYLRLNCERELRNKLFRITNQIAFVKNMSDSITLAKTILSDTQSVFSTLRYVISNEYEKNVLKNYEFFLDYIKQSNKQKILETLTDISKLQKWGYIDFINVFYETLEKLTYVVDKLFTKKVEF